MKIAVASPSFSKNEHLRSTLRQRFPDSSPSFHLGDELQGNDFIGFASEAEIVVVGKETVDQSTINALPNLKAIAKYGVGLDRLDLDALAESGVAFLYQAGVNAPYVAEHALGLIINLLRNLGYSDRLMHQGVWRKNGGTSLWNKSVAIVGCGFCGSALTRVLQPFACDLYLVDILDKSELATETGGRLASLEEALGCADVVSLHLPLDETTRGMIGSRQFDLMKPSSVLINTSRGEVVDQNALIQALRTGSIAGAGIDVFEEEPLTDSRLYSQDNFLGTAHMAGNSEESVRAMGIAAIDGISGFLLKKP